MYFSVSLRFRIFLVALLPLRILSLKNTANMSNKKTFYMGENLEIYSCMIVREFLKAKGLKRALAVFDAETKRVRAECLFYGWSNPFFL